MEITKENVVDVLLSSESYLEDSECLDYVIKLGQFNLEDLASEPEKLEEERKNLLKQTQELAFSNYKTFIQRADCLNEIHSKFVLMQENLNSVTKELPNFKANCENLMRVSSKVDTHRKKNSLVLLKSNELLKVLELPQLMENCIKNGHFEEALELSSYIKWLGKKHSNLKLVKSIVEDSDALWQEMLNQLIAQLRTDIQLPKCLEIVGFIRRMQIFSDAELRLQFLQARDTWFSNVLASICHTDVTQYILKVIECTRIHLFNIITQYRAIFSDEEVVDADISTVNKTYIFYSWLNEKISQFLGILDNPEIVNNISSLNSIIGQSMYFALAFSRVGADFRCLLVSKFMKIIQQYFDQAIRKNNKKFKQDMDKFSINKISPVAKIKTNVDSKPEHPPIALIEFYPLVDYLNGILTTFNEVRSFIPLALADFITNLIQDSLKFCAKVILSYHKVEQQTFEKAEREKFSRFCNGFQILVNYLQKYIHLVFPIQEIANHIGIPIHQLQKEGLTFINESIILEQIVHLLPLQPASEINSETLS